MNLVAIWWLNQADVNAAKALGAEMAAWPEYILDEFVSRDGRPGRGRFWCGSALEKETGINFENLKEVTGTYDFICEPNNNYGGIVIRMRDVHHVLGWPGFLTDIHMRPLTWRGYND